MAPRQKHQVNGAGATKKDGASASLPRWSRIAGDIAAAIEAGEHGEGSTLPAAALIAAQYGVNRHTVRQALRYLQDLGLVTVERGRGTIVRGQRFPYRLGRRVSFRANFGAAGIDAAGEVVESGIGPASAEIARQLRLPVGARVWEIRTLSRAAGVAVSTGVHWLSAERFPGFDRRLLAARASITAAFATYGISDYVRLSTRLSARAATRAEARLLGLGRAAPVLQSAAVDGLEDGRPLQVVVAAFAGERVEMVLEQAG
jgi:GntR family phosphonate transport system transcriptional regulator